MTDSSDSVAATSASSPLDSLPSQCTIEDPLKSLDFSVLSDKYERPRNNELYGPEGIEPLRTVWSRSAPDCAEMPVPVLEPCGDGVDWQPSEALRVTEARRLTTEDSADAALLRPPAKRPFASYAYPVVRLRATPRHTGMAFTAVYSRLGSPLRCARMQKAQFEPVSMAPVYSLCYLQAQKFRQNVPVRDPLRVSTCHRRYSPPLPSERQAFKLAPLSTSVTSYSYSLSRSQQCRIHDMSERIELSRDHSASEILTELHNAFKLADEADDDCHLTNSSFSDPIVSSSKRNYNHQIANRFYPSHQMEPFLHRTNHPTHHYYTANKSYMVNEYGERWNTSATSACSSQPRFDVEESFCDLSLLPEAGEAFVQHFPLSPAARPIRNGAEFLAGLRMGSAPLISTKIDAVNSPRSHKSDSAAAAAAVASPPYKELTASTYSATLSALRSDFDEDDTPPTLKEVDEVTIIQNGVLVCSTEPESGYVPMRGSATGTPVSACSTSELASMRAMESGSAFPVCAAFCEPSTVACSTWRTSSRSSIPCQTTSSVAAKSITASASSSYAPVSSVSMPQLNITSDVFHTIVLDEPDDHPDSSMEASLFSYEATEDATEATLRSRFVAFFCHFLPTIFIWLSCRRRRRQNPRISSDRDLEEPWTSTGVYRASDC